MADVFGLGLEFVDGEGEVGFTAFASFFFSLFLFKGLFLEVDLRREKGEETGVVGVVEDGEGGVP